MAGTALWAAEATQKFVKPIANNVGVYKDKTHEFTDQPLFTIGTDDRLLIVETKGDVYKVQNATGTGWVEEKTRDCVGCEDVQL